MGVDAVNPQSKLLFAIAVGPRMWAMTQWMVHQVRQVLAPGCVSLFVIDGFMVFGTLAAVRQVLAAYGWQISMAFMERLNLTIRQHVVAVDRRVSTLCKGGDGSGQQLALYHAYYIFCLPHASLRQLLPQPVLTPVSRRRHSGRLHP